VHYLYSSKVLEKSVSTRIIAYSKHFNNNKFMILVIFSKLLIVLYYVWVAISAILWLVCPSAVLSFIIVLLLIWFYCCKFYEYVYVWI